MVNEIESSSKWTNNALQLFSVLFPFFPFPSFQKHRRIIHRPTLSFSRDLLFIYRPPYCFFLFIFPPRSEENYLRDFGSFYQCFHFFLYKCNTSTSSEVSHVMREKKIEFMKICFFSFSNFNLHASFFISKQILEKTSLYQLKMFLVKIAIVH